MADRADLIVKYPSLKKFEEMGDDYKEWDDGREQALLKHIKQRPDFESIKGHPQKLIAAIDEFSSQLDFLINIGPDKGQKVAAIIAGEKPKIFVEFGGYLGYSALTVADQMRQIAKGTESLKLYSLEFDPDFADIAREFVAIAGLSDIVEVVTGAAGDSVRKLHTNGTLDHIDMLFIDHGEGGIELYEKDLKICLELGLLHSGACIVADNVLRPGAPDYRKFVRSQPRLKSKGVPALIMPGEFEDELEVTKVV